MYKWIGLNKIEVLIFTDQDVTWMHMNVIPTMCATVLFELTSSVSSIPLNLKSTPNTNEFTFTDHTYAITFTHTRHSMHGWMEDIDCIFLWYDIYTCWGEMILSSASAIWYLSTPPVEIQWFYHCWDSHTHLLRCSHSKDFLFGD